MSEFKGFISHKFTTSDNTNLHFEINFEITDKKLDDIILFNYGLVCSNTHFKYQIKYFHELGYKIVLHDYRGHFQSEGKDNLSLVTFKNMTSDIKELCDYLNIEKAKIISHSMGVNVSLELTKRFPEMFPAAVLISGTTMPVYEVMFNSNFSDHIQPKLKQLLKKYPKIFQTFWKYTGVNPIVKKIVHIGGFNTKFVSKDFIEIYLTKVGELGPEIFFQLLDQMNEHDIMSFLHKLKSRFLIIGGNQDKVIPNYLQRVLHSELTNSDLYILQNGSHVPQVDFPENVNSRIIQFFNS